MKTMDKPCIACGDSSYHVLGSASCLGRIKQQGNVADMLAEVRRENERLNAKLDLLAATTPLAAPKPEACGAAPTCSATTHKYSHCDCTSAPVSTRCAQCGCAAREHVDDEELGQCTQCDCGQYVTPTPVEAQAEHPHTKLLRMVAGCAPEFDDARVDYLTIQIDRDLWDDIRAALATKESK